MQSASVKGISRITDKHGANLKQEIQDYMRYGIWDTVAEESEAETLWKELKEAESLQTVSEAYSGHAREAARMNVRLKPYGNRWRTRKSIVKRPPPGCPAGMDPVFGPPQSS